MIVLSNRSRILLIELRAESEGQEINGWRNVYLDNVNRNGLSPRQFSWALSSLASAGFYRSIDGGVFGDVKMTDA